MPSQQLRQLQMVGCHAAAAALVTHALVPHMHSHQLSVYSMQVKGIWAWRGRNCNNCCSLTCTQPPIPWRACHDVGPRAGHSRARDRSTGHTRHKIIHVATPLPALPHLPKGVIATPKTARSQRTCSHSSSHQRQPHGDVALGLESSGRIRVGPVMHTHALPTRTDPLQPSRQGHSIQPALLGYAARTASGIPQQNASCSMRAVVWVSTPPLHVPVVPTRAVCSCPCCSST